MLSYSLWYFPWVKVNPIYYIVVMRKGSKGFGELAEYNPRTDTIWAYVERAMLFFEANREQTIACFSQFNWWRELWTSMQFNGIRIAKEQTSWISDSCAGGHFNPKPAVMVECFKFHKREQLPGETIAEYVAELRRLSTYCNFGGYLNKGLRDRLVCDLRSESTQRRLLAIKDLTLKEAVEQA